MFSDATRAEVSGFLDQVAQMTVDDFAIVARVSLDAYPVCKPARELMKLGAADFSWLDKRVNGVVGLMLGRLDWPSVHLSSRAMPLTLSCAQAIVRRDRLSAEQYEAFVGGFRQVGVVIPPIEPIPADGQ
jgi:hypothetical protein